MVTKSPGSTVLVVVDVSANVELLKTLLTREGYIALTASRRAMNASTRSFREQGVPV